LVFLIIFLLNFTFLNILLFFSLFQSKIHYFRQKILISGITSLFQAKNPYFRQKILISGKNSLFQAKIPYFRQKYLKINPRLVFKDVVLILAMLLASNP
jgi:hypothetical protein